MLTLDSTRSMVKTLGTALLLSLTAAPHMVSAQDASANPANPPMPLYTSFETIERVQRGGYILLIRHERTEMPSRADDYSKSPSECRAQRNLSVAGVVGASENGNLLKAANIDVSRVLTSPMCRAAETARYMFGVGYETDDRLMHHNPAKDSDHPLSKAAQETASVLGEITQIAKGSNVALISHGGNIFKSTGLRLGEGEIGVLQVSEAGEIKAIGQFTGSTLGFYVRMKQAEKAKSEQSAQ